MPGIAAIFIADRGYASYNIFAHAQQRGMYYLVRIKDIGSCTSMTASFPLPQTEEFDTDVHLTLTRKQIKQARACSGVYKFLPGNCAFDYLEQNPISLRVVRFPITADTYECVITNLPRDAFSPNELKILYAMRWGIETSFRELK